MPKIKKEWRIHIICGALTLLMVLFIYIFYDETIGQVQHVHRPLKNEVITIGQIDENYRLAKEITLNNNILTDYVPHNWYLLYETKRDNISTDDMIVFVESSSSPINLEIAGDERLSDDGKYYRHEDSGMNTYVSGEGIRLDTEKGVNYSLFLSLDVAVGKDVIDVPPDTLSGTIKIYERIGGGDDE